MNINFIDLQGQYQKYFNYKEGDFPITEKVSKDIMALPISAFLTDEEQDYIIKVINE